MPLLIKGKMYQIPTKQGVKEIALYPIAKLVSELEKSGYPRSDQTIRKWEDSGVTPPATLRSGNKRLYSKAHIEAYVKIAKECHIRQGFSIAQTDFSERIWAEIASVNKNLGLS